MAVEFKQETQIGEQAQPYTISLEDSTVDFLRWFIEGKLKAAGDIDFYLRLSKSLARPLPTPNGQLKTDYGVDYEDFVSFAEEVDTRGLRWPPLLRNLVQINDAFVQAGAPSAGRRASWLEVAEIIESDFGVWREKDESTIKDRNMNGQSRIFSKNGTGK